MSGNQSVVLIGSRSTLSVVGFHLLRKMGVSIPLIIAGDEDGGSDDWRLSLVKVARDSGYRDGDTLLVLQNPHKPEVIERIRSLRADLILSLQWRRILKEPLLGLAQNGVVNLHNAPLPMLRGCDPFSWAIHDGLEVMGVTLHRVIDEGVDSGPVLAQRLWPLSETTTAWDLYLESLREAELLMHETLEAIIEGRLPCEAQEARYASYHPMGQFRFSDLEVDWNLPAVALSAALRARIFPPFQLPYFERHRERINIRACRAVKIRAKSGEIGLLDPLTVGAKFGALELSKVKVNGEEMPGAEYARRSSLRIGDSLGGKERAK